MATINSLIEEFERETQTTRKHFERLPGDKLEWRPHQKSFTAGGLASHIVECLSWTDAIVNQEEFEMDPATYKFYRATSADDLLKTFEAKVALAGQALAAVTDADLMKPWRLKVSGRQLFEKPRAVVIRDFVLSHIIHHRGQFSVYLRLLDIPVPGSYGPSADEPLGGSV